MHLEDIKFIKNFVEPEDAQSLIDLMDDLRSRKKLNNERKDGTFRIYNSNYPEVVEFVKKYSKKFIGDQNLYFRENLVALYEEGSFMYDHKDVENDTETVSTVIYLNDAYTGGELSFPEINNGYTYAPEKYELVYFPTPFLHGVTPVKSGKRYIITISYTDQFKYKNPKY